mmetsp:Transcript_26876/g.35764  ORF Transcript_26876/g.35764 Transcript_26876/m.35764 type:complete len:85 (+) Transcript_26876:52-306(+)
MISDFQNIQMHIFRVRLLSLSLTLEGRSRDFSLETISYVFSPFSPTPTVSDDLSRTESTSFLCHHYISISNTHRPASEIMSSSK